MVSYPVHKVLLYGESVPGLIYVSKLLESSKLTETHPSAIKGFINIPGYNAPLDPSLENRLSMIDVDQGLTAISEFRSSIEHATEYEHGWLGSHLSSANDFLTAGTSVPSLQDASSLPPSTRNSSIKPALKTLISILLQTTTSSIDSEETRAVTTASTNRIPPLTLSDLQAQITTWAEDAHSELRDSLDSAFSSVAWNRLKWWKLVWRVDDVGFILGDVLERKWLVDAEKGLIWVAGRMGQIGLSPLRPEVESAATTWESTLEQTSLASMNPINTGSHATPLPAATAAMPRTSIPKPSNLTTPSEHEHKFGTYPPEPRLIDLLPTSDLPRPSSNPPVYPQSISLARTALSTTTIPSLQALAQQLLAQSLGTIATTSTLSALLYIGVSTTSLYEAGTIAALGIVWSARRLQSKWETARESWAVEIREEGRLVLKEVEEQLRDCVSDVDSGVGGGVGQGEGIGEQEDEAMQERKKARAAVSKVQVALDDMTV